MRIRSFALASLLAVGGLVLTSACGSSSNGGGGSGNGATGDCNSVATAACNKLEQCSAFAIKAAYGDAATCVKRLEMGCTASTTAPGAKVTAAQFGACADAYSKVDCTKLTGGMFLPDACTVPGSLANGKACGSADQCQSGYCSSSTGICGTCGDRAAAGKACTSSDGCQSGLVCNSKSVCAQPVAAGGQCSDVRDCDAGLVCASGTCSQPVAVGKACTGSDCDQLAGAFCNPQTKVCASISVADAGQPCGIVNNTFVGCGAAGHCTIPQGQTKGTCQAAAADGASCDPQNGPTCMAPAICVNGKCTLPDPSSCK